MRRSACLLALMGLSVQTAAGQETVSGAARPTPASARSMQFFNGAASTPQQGATPQRFTRSNAPTAGESDLQNYYKELFGSETKEPATDPAPTSRVVQAEYQPQADATQPEIQQIRAERFGARPFPGGEPTPAATPAPARTTLTEPISVQGKAAAPTPPTGSVTISNKGTTARPVKAAPSRTAAAPASPISAGSISASSTPATVVTTEASVGAPAVSVNWKKESEFNVGQECRCQLVVKNSGQSAAQDVQVRAFFPANVRLVKAVPAPAHSEEFLGWQLNELKAGEEKAIDVVMVPLQRGDINTRADVRFSGSASGLFSVAEPLLGLEIEGPAQVLIGEPAPHTVTVTNPGTGIANNVQIEAKIPDGLEHARGQRLVMELGSLNPGESRSVRLALAASKGGHHRLEVEARAESGLVRQEVAELAVIAPSLNSRIAGPAMRYLGRQGTYTLTVSNDGAAATDNVRMMHRIPSGFEFVSSDRGAQYDSATGILNWFVGRLEKGQQSEIKVTLMAREIGEHKHLIRATSEHGSMSDADFTTYIEGTSSLALRVKDLEDPVEVGSEMTYEIQVKNEGSASARNVSLGCELPAGMAFVQANGPTPHLHEPGAVIFRAIPELAAGQTVVYKVSVSAKAAASLRFKAHLSSDSVSDPLTAEELTKFYGE